MSRREEYERKAEAMLAPIVEESGFELVDVEYVKVGRKLVSSRLYRQAGRYYSQRLRGGKPEVQR